MSEQFSSQNNAYFRAHPIEEGGVDDRVGLHDGQFIVQRTNGEIQTGWNIQSVHEASNQDGISQTLVTITRKEGDQELTKTVPKEVLLSWQPEEEGANNLRLNSLGLDKDESGARPDQLSEARRLFTENQHNWLLGNDEVDNAIAKLGPDERAKFDSWQLEQAAVRAPKLVEIINSAQKDSAGNYKLDEAATPKFVEFLESYGVAHEAPTVDAIQTGINHAKESVRVGRAAVELSQMPFINENDIRGLMANTSGTRVIFSSEAYIDPELIKGAYGHDSWAGRGFKGGGEVSVREINRPDGKTGTRASIDQIADYATRDTQLPPFDFLGLNLVLTGEGPIFYSSNAHRVSAAKLRREPLRFSSIAIYDAR